MGRHEQWWTGTLTKASKLAYTRSRSLDSESRFQVENVIFEIIRDSMYRGKHL